MDGNDTWLVVGFIEDLQRAWTQLSHLPFWCAIVHFFISALLSWPASRLFGSDTTQTAKKLAKIREIRTKALIEGKILKKQTVKAHSAIVRNYILQYTFITGAVSAAIIYIQFDGSCQVPWAVLYGVIGPFALQEILISFIGGKNGGTLSKETSKLLELPKNVEKSVNTDYQNELDRLGALIESEISDFGKPVTTEEGDR